MAGRKLTPRKQAFADEYIITGVAEEIARVAGYFARGNTSKLLQNTTILTYIEDRRATESFGVLHEDHAWGRIGRTSINRL